MILPSVLVTAYTVINLSIAVDEIWNMYNPRPFPKKPYRMMQWEEDDFIKMNDGSYILRKSQKADSDLKKRMRNKLGSDAQNRFRFTPKS